MQEEITQKNELTILYVEDDPPSLTYTTTILKSFVDKIYIALDGREGLELYKRYKPDIVISDINMPYLNGIELARKIKEINPKTQVIFTTAFDNSSFLLESISLGISNYIIKPVQKKQMMDAIQRASIIVNMEKDLAKQTEIIRKLSLAVECSPTMTIILNTDGFVEYANQRFYEITGYTKEEVIDQEPDFLHFYDNTNQNFGYFKQDFDLQGYYHGEFLNKTKNGENLWLSVSVASVNNTNKNNPYYVVVMEDITELKLTHHELEKSNADLEERVINRTQELTISNQKLLNEIEIRRRTEKDLLEAKEKAELANKYKSTFLAKVSHELRTPMNGILGMTSVLLDTNLDDNQKKYCGIVNLSANNLLKIINDLLDLSKIESGKVQFYNVKFYLSEVVDQVFDLESLEAKNKGLKLDSIIQPDVPQKLIGDPGRLQQILTNLINNAIKFTNTGSVSLNIELINILDGFAEIKFIVEDTGIGIKEDKIELLFQSFSQVDGSLTRKYGGTGLGLAISRELVEMMDGKIYVESNFGKGSRFIFSIRLRMQELSTPDKEIYAKHFNDVSLQDIYRKYPDIPLKILVAEDSLINQEVLKTVLISKKWDPIFTSTGIEALDVFYNEDIDIILLDVQMPEMDGIETAKLIRDYEKGNNTHKPIIGITADGSEDHIIDCISAGMDACIVKPFDWNDMFSKIFSLVGNVYSHSTNISDNKEIPPENLDIIDDQGILQDHQSIENSSLDQDIPEILEHVEEEMSSESKDDGPAIENVKTSGIQKLYETLNFNKIVLKNLISYYISNYPSEIDLIRNHLSSEEYVEAGRALHKLKSETGNFGAAGALEVIRNLEDCLKTNPTSCSGIIATDLSRELGNLESELKEFESSLE
jgi:PAS domain S-box-containing protein